jgi:addiction module HigA family antidote
VPPGNKLEKIEEKRAVTADTALRLSKYFSSSAMFRMNLQTLYDLEEKELELSDALKGI